VIYGVSVNGAWAVDPRQTRTSGSARIATVASSRFGWVTDAE